MFRTLIENSIRHRLTDIYEKLAFTARGLAELSDKLTDIIDHVTENRRTLNVLIEMQTQTFVAEEKRLRADIPSLSDLLSSTIDDDEMPN